MRQGADLERLLGYQLQRAHLLLEDDVRAALTPCGLSPAKMTALLLIRENPGCGQTALGRALSVNRSSAMKLVNILVELGLIERRPGRDLRTNALYLIPKGEKLVREVVERVRESDTRMSARLNKAELDALHTLLRKLGPSHGRKAKRVSEQAEASAA